MPAYFPQNTYASISLEKLIIRKKKLDLDDRMSSRMVKCAALLNREDFAGWQMIVPTKGISKPKIVSDKIPVIPLSLNSPPGYDNRRGLIVSRDRFRHFCRTACQVSAAKAHEMASKLSFERSCSILQASRAAVCSSTPR